jgi:putative chitinase
MTWLARFLGFGAARREAAGQPLAPPLAPLPIPVSAVGYPAPPAVTAELLTRLGWVAPGAFADALGPACRRYGIVTPVRLAAFLAQVGHESAGGRYTREIWGDTPAQLRYEGRVDLGNTQPGDGRRFLGRGLIQITGRTSTLRAREALRPTMAVEELCTWLQSTAGASESACWWWAAHGCNEIADAGDFERLTRRINGGLSGLADRRDRWAEAKAALGV